MARISLRGVEFSYPVYGDRSLRNDLMRNLVGGGVSKKAGGAIFVKALAGIDLELHEGERLGIVGRNGSGKSTLLSMLAGLISPDAGTIQIEGRVVSTIARGLGINQEETGRRNIELPLRLLGATNEEVERAKEFVPKWTGLGPYIDLPVRTYSDGMRARLSFALSTSVRGDILILDEWMTAGDADFVAKARQRLTTMVARSGIVALSSHSMSLIESMCTKVCWLDQGRVVMVGAPRHVTHAYRTSTLVDIPTPRRRVGLAVSREDAGDAAVAAGD